MSLSLQRVYPPYGYDLSIILHELMHNEKIHCGLTLLFGEITSATRPLQESAGSISATVNT